MIRKCDLTFKENDILTKEMLTQMNLEPKWLLLDSYPEDGVGVISGFDFKERNSLYVLTKGNLWISGSWYRMSEDFVIETDQLISGQFYQIYFKKQEGKYIVEMAEKKLDFAMEKDDIPIAVFKYELQKVFRIPDKLDQMKPEYKQAYLHDISLSYYSSEGIPICNPVLTRCILNSLKDKKIRTWEETLITYEIYNTGKISLSAIADYIGVEENSELMMNQDLLIEKLHNCICQRHSENQVIEHKNGESVQQTKRKRRGFSS